MAGARTKLQVVAYTENWRAGEEAPFAGGSRDGGIRGGWRWEDQVVGAETESAALAPKQAVAIVVAVCSG